MEGLETVQDLGSYFVNASEAAKRGGSLLEAAWADCSQEPVYDIGMIKQALRCGAPHRVARTRRARWMRGKWRRRPARPQKHQ
eukprot:1688836-Heterocapsa_arctica.AAC.1